MFKSQTFSNANHGFIYFNDFTLYGFGDNSYGQLGLGHCNDIKEPEFIMKDKDIIKIICSTYNTLLLKKDGSIYISGKTHGLVDETEISTFRYVYQDRNIKDVVFHKDIVCLLMMDNTGKILIRDKILELPHKNILNIFITDEYYYEGLYLYLKTSEIHILTITKNGEVSDSKYFKTIDNLKDIFYIKHKRCIITDKTIELHDENNVEVKYKGDDIRQVFANEKRTIVRKMDNAVYEINNGTENFTLSLMFGLAQQYLHLGNEQINSVKNIINPDNLLYLTNIDENDLIYNYYSSPLILTEISVESENNQCIDLLYDESSYKNKNFNQMIRKANNDTDILGKIIGKSDKINKQLPLIYEVPIKIFGSGSIKDSFDIKEYIYLPNYLKKSILFSSLCFYRYKVENHLNIPRFIRYLIFDWLIYIQ